MSLTVTGECILHNLALKNNDLMEIEVSDGLDNSTDRVDEDFNVPLAVTQRNGIDKRNELALK